MIWDKGPFAIGRSWYHWGHEPCWVVRRAGSKTRFLGERNQSTIWRAPSPKMIMGGSDEPKVDHPTQKPVALYEAPIGNHLRRGEAVYDPFLGSGTAPPSGSAGDATPWRSIPATSKSRSSAGKPSAGKPR